MLPRVVPEEGQDVLPEDSTPWAKRDIVWLPQIVSFLSLPLLSSLKAVE
jgi:hypothetical protein